LADALKREVGPRQHVWAAHTSPAPTQNGGGRGRVIRRDIVTGVLKEGEQLPQLPSDRAVRRLEADHPRGASDTRIETLIEVRRGASGARVQLPNEEAAGRAVGILLQLDQTTLKDVWQARMTFEPPLAGLLASLE